MGHQEMVKCFTDLQTFSEEQRSYLAFEFWGMFMIGGHEGTPQMLLDRFKMLATLSEEEFWEMRFTHPMKEMININHKEFSSFFSGQKSKDWLDLFMGLEEAEQGVLMMVFSISTMAKDQGYEPKKAVKDELGGVSDKGFNDLLDLLKPHI